ncbi:WD40 repeat domain-containing protein [Scytonema sp. PCC 10023]|uniref:WD40 repeat domain-containing protein n=1 Tax=Scytonema sp. PCC 10023 TaxID=1680591 RepID=UPI0039C70848
MSTKSTPQPLQPPSTDIQQHLKGNNNQSIGKMNGGNAFGTVEGSISIIYNYYYREDTQIVPVPIESTSAPDDNLPCPYRGLFHFGPNDADVFFGREVFVQELFAATQKRNFIPVLGGSGSGKSSVVLAGLVPKLQKEGDWLFTHFRPGSDPFHALAEALVPLYTSGDSTTQIIQARKLAQALGDSVITLHDILSHIQRLHPNHRLLLIADQFEELYTLCTEQKIRRSFLDTLLASFQSSPSITQYNNVLVATMRADFLGDALSIPQFGDLLRNADVKIRSMNHEELSQVIEKPAEKLGVGFETALVKRILDDVKDEPGNLPLLEFALTQLWKRRKGKQLTHAAYEEIGKVQGALARHADENYCKLSATEQEQVRRIFIQLVRPGEGTEDTRRLATKAELSQASWGLIKHLADARLVVTSRNAADQETVEVVHEALIRNWGELRQWMDADRCFRTWQEQLRVAMRTWESSGFDEGALLRGKPLVDAEDWQAKRFIELSSLERSFIGLSVELRKQQSKKQRRKRQLTISSLTGSLVLALMLAGVVAWQWQKSVEQTAISKATSAESLLQTNPIEGLVQAIDAIGSSQSLFSRVPPREVQSSLLSAVQIAQKGTIERNILRSHGGDVLSVRISPDGKYIANSNLNKTVQLWDFKGNLIAHLKGHTKRVPALAFSPDGKYIVTGSEDKTLRLWDIKNGKPIGNPFQGHQRTVHSVAFSPDGKYILSGPWDGTLRLWNMKGNLINKPFKAQEKNIYSVAFSPDGQYIVSGADSTITLWDLKGNPVREPFKVGSKVFSVAFSPDGKYIVSGSDDQTVRLWDINGKLISQPFRGHEGAVKSVTFTDKKTIISGGSDKTVRRWDLKGNPIGQAFQGHEAAVTSVTISRDGKTIISGSEDGTIRLWDTEKSSIGKPIGHDWEVKSVAFSPDERYIVSACLDGKVRLWDIQGNLIKTFPGHESGVLKAVFSPDGQYIASSSQDGTIRLWDIKGNPVSKPLKGHLDPVQAIAFSPDSKYIVSGGEDKTLRLWDIKGNLIVKFLLKHEGGVNSVTFSLDGKYIISGSDDKTIRLWNLKGEPIREPFKGHEDKVTSIAISPDKNYIVSGSSDKTLRLWDMNGKQIDQPFKGHESQIFSVAFSPDGQYIASSGEDKTVRLWDINGNPIGTPLMGHDGGVWSVAISPDGHTIASGAWDSKMRLWQGGTWQTLLQLGCKTLRGHSVLVEPQTQVAKSAALICQKYVWDK